MFRFFAPLTFSQNERFIPTGNLARYLSTPAGIHQSQY